MTAEGGGLNGSNVGYEWDNLPPMNGGVRPGAA